MLTEFQALFFFSVFILLLSMPFSVALFDDLPFERRDNAGWARANEREREDKNEEFK